MDEERRYHSHQEGIERHHVLNGDGKTATPRRGRAAAPKPAAAEMPSVNGLASGLARIVCNLRAGRTRARRRPSRPSARWGMRMSQITTRRLIGYRLGMKQGRQNVRKGIIGRASAMSTATEMNRRRRGPDSMKSRRKTRARYRPRPSMAAISSAIAAIILSVGERHEIAGR